MWSLAVVAGVHDVSDVVKIGAPGCVPGGRQHRLAAPGGQDSVVGERHW